MDSYHLYYRKYCDHQYIFGIFTILSPGGNVRAIEFRIPADQPHEAIEAGTTTRLNFVARRLRGKPRR